MVWSTGSQIGCGFEPGFAPVSYRNLCVTFNLKFSMSFSLKENIMRKSAHICSLTVFVKLPVHSGPTWEQQNPLTVRGGLCRVDVDKLYDDDDDDNYDALICLLNILGNLFFWLNVIKAFNGLPIYKNVPMD